MYTYRFKETNIKRRPDKIELINVSDTGFRLYNCKTHFVCCWSKAHSANMAAYWFSEVNDNSWQATFKQMVIVGIYFLHCTFLVRLSEMKIISKQTGRKTLIWKNCWIHFTVPGLYSNRHDNRLSMNVHHPETVRHKLLNCMMYKAFSIVFKCILWRIIILF